MCHRGPRADADPLRDVGRQGHHRPCELHRHRAVAGQDRPRRASATPTQARFLDELRLASCWRRRCAGGRATRRSCSTSTRWRAVQRILGFAQGGGGRARSTAGPIRRRATARTSLCSRGLIDRLVARLICRIAAAAEAGEAGPGHALARGLFGFPAFGKRELFVPLASAWCCRFIADAGGEGLAGGLRAHA
jgi:hypothetical protein